MQTLKIGIDIAPLAGVRTGIGNHLQHLLAALSGMPGFQPTWFTGAAWRDGPLPDCTAGTGGGPAARLAAALPPWLRLPLREAWSHLVVRSRFNAGAAGLDAVHCHDILPFPMDVPEILTVFDTSCFRHPELHPSWRVAWQQQYLPRAINRCAHVITISEFSRGEIIHFFGLPPERITVTPCGVDPAFRPRSATETGTALAAHGLDHGAYFLAVGTVEPRKNLSTLVRAHAMLPSTVQHRYPLVIAGKLGWMTEAFMDIARPALARGTVRLLGYAPAEELPRLYAGARVFLYPSTYEGFGLPALEALACAIPTAVSNSSSLPEVVGDAALQLPAEDVDSWREAMATLADDAGPGQRLARLGRERAAAFTWERTARLTLGVYRQVAGSGTRA